MYNSTSIKRESIRIMKIKSYGKSDWNPYYFFQPAFPEAPAEAALMLVDQSHALPNPLDKHRIPTPRLVPPGSFNRG